MKVKAPTEMIKDLVTFNIAVCTCYNCNIPSLNKLSLSLSLILLALPAQNASVLHQMKSKVEETS